MDISTIFLPNKPTPVPQYREKKKKKQIVPLAKRIGMHYLMERMKVKKSIKKTKQAQVSLMGGTDIKGTKGTRGRSCHCQDVCECFPGWKARSEEFHEHWRHRGV